MCCMVKHFFYIPPALVVWWCTASQTTEFTTDHSLLRATWIQSMTSHPISSQTSKILLIYPSMRPCVTLHNMWGIHGERLLGPCQTLKLEDHPFSATGYIVSNANHNVITNFRLVKMWKLSWLILKYDFGIFSRTTGKPHKTCHNCEALGQEPNWGSPE